MAELCRVESRRVAHYKITLRLPQKGKAFQTVRRKARYFAQQMRGVDDYRSRVRPIWKLIMIARPACFSMLSFQLGDRVEGSA